jgi:hypothetical protein
VDRYVAKVLARVLPPPITPGGNAIDPGPKFRPVLLKVMEPGPDTKEPPPTSAPPLIAVSELFVLRYPEIDNDALLITVFPILLFRDERVPEVRTKVVGGQTEYDHESDRV